MIWLVWRRQRAALLVALGVVVLVAVALGVGRLRALGIAGGSGLTGCLRAVTAPCENQAWYAYRDGFGTFFGLTRTTVLALPAVLGITAGAGLFGRELERGTHVFALAQAVGRVRWWLTGLLVAGVPVAVAAALVTAVNAWAFEPFPALTGSSALQTPNFEDSGLMPVAYTLLAFTLAAGAGLVLRNAMGAVALAFALQLGLQLVLSFALREHYLAPEVSRYALDSNEISWPDGSWYLGQGYLSAAGRELSGNLFNGNGCTATTQDDFTGCLRAAGVVQQYVRYQPASRYWPFQGIESGIVLILVAGALGGGAWGLRRRVH